MYHAPRGLVIGPLVKLGGLDGRRLAVAQQLILEVVQTHVTRRACPGHVMAQLPGGIGGFECGFTAILIDEGTVQGSFRRFKDRG